MTLLNKIWVFTNPALIWYFKTPIYDIGLIFVCEDSSFDILAYILLICLPTLCRLSYKKDINVYTYMHIRFRNFLIILSFFLPLCYWWSLNNCSLLILSACLPMIFYFLYSSFFFNFLFFFSNSFVTYWCYHPWLRLKTLIWYICMCCT